MNKNVRMFLQHMMLYGAGGIVNGLARFCFIPIIAAHLPPDIFGVYSLLLMIISFLFIFFDFGLSYALIKHYSQSHDPQFRAKIIGTSLALIGAVGGCVGAIILYFSPVLSTVLLQSAHYSPLVRLAVCIALSSAVFQLLTSILRASAEPRSFIIATGLRGVAQIAFVISFVVLFSCGIEGFLWGNLLSFALGAIAFLFLFRPPLHMVPGFATKLLCFGLPLMPSNLALWLLTYADLYLLKRLMGLEAVGLYQFAQELCAVIALILVSFERAWPPFVFSRCREEGAAEQFRQVFLLFFSIVIFFGLTLSLFRFELLAILSADSYGNSVAVVPLLACSGILYGTYYVFGTGLLIQGKTIFFPMITIAAAAVNIALNLILIPEFGIVGAGLATVITNFIMTLTVLSLSHRYYSISFGLRTVLLTGGAGIGAYTIHHAVRGHTHHPWIAAAVLLAGFGLLIWTSVRSFFGNESAGMDWQRSFRRSGTTP